MWLEESLSRKLKISLLCKNSNTVYRKKLRDNLEESVITNDKELMSLICFFLNFFKKSESPKKNDLKEKNTLKKSPQRS